MGLEERVTELERRLAELEGMSAPGRAAPGSVASPAAAPDFWALNELKVQLADLGSPGGGVVFAGAVRLAAGEHYEWQYGALTEPLLDETDWSRAAESFAALGHGVRLRLLREILGGRGTAAELSELDGMGTTGQIYHHLRQLTAAGWLQPKGRGRHQVPAGRVVPLLVMLSATGP